LHHLARVYYWAFQDVPRAAAALQRAGELLAPLPLAPNIEPLVEGARCLASLEVGIPRARELFANLGRIRGATGLIGYRWGMGLILRWEGDGDGARRELGLALAMAQQAKKHWAAFETAATLAMLEIESGNEVRARALAAELRPLAERLGEGGSEGPLVDALEAVARLRAGDAGADAAVDAAARALERIDSQYHLGSVLNTAAAIDLHAGRLAAARRRAGAALRASTVANRDVEIRRAHLVLAAVEAREGRPDGARAELDAAGPVDADALPAHARALLAALGPLAGTDGP